MPSVPILSEKQSGIPESGFLANAFFWGFIAVLASAIYVGFHLQSGWFPHDEGQLGQAAERVLMGELPHRDFDEMYTGGLTYLNALSFKWFGIRCESTRWMLFLFFIPFCGTVFWIASRACPPPVASLVTFFCAAISLPVYSAAIPSWYNLFFMTFGVACLFRFIDCQRYRWIFAAGIFAGLSILFKITGLYWLAAAILFLVYQEQIHPSGRNEKSIGFDIFTLACLGVFALLGLGYCQSSDWAMAAIHLTMPMVAISLFLGFQQLRTRKGPFRVRITRLIGLQAPLLLATAIPVLLFVGFYASQGAIGSLYEGLVVLPRQRLDGAHSPFPAWPWLLCSVPIAAIFFARHLPAFPKWEKSWPYTFGLLLVGGLLLISSWKQPFGFQLTFQSLRNLGPFVCIALLGLLLSRTNQKSDARDQSQLFLICVASAMACLVQFPFASDFYFLYAAPLVVLAAVHATRWQPVAVRKIQLAALGLFLLFAVLRMSTPIPNININGPAQAREHRSVGLSRCSLVVNARTAELYRQVIEEIQNRTRPGEYIFAGPDFPEAYFLADRPNPTRVFYDFFRPELQNQPRELIELLAERRVKLVVIKKIELFSKLNPEFEQAIGEHFPHQKRINRYQRPGQDEADVAFVIYWRDSAIVAGKSTE